MKRTQRPSRSVYETVRPFDAKAAAEAGPDGLFDDCPHCQALRKSVESGKARKVADQPSWVRDLWEEQGWWST